MSKLKAIYRADFEMFVRKCFMIINDEALGDDGYVSHLCYVVEQIVEGSTSRVVVNLPPGHLKTFIFSVCMVLWLLLRNGKKHVIIVTNAQPLAERITHTIRRIMRTSWWKEISDIRVAVDRSSAGDFMTNKGGRVLATSIEANFTGERADVVIADDLLDIKEAGDDIRVEGVNKRFHSKILSRLNHPKTDIVAVIAHRLHPHDLSDHLKRLGGWHHVVLEYLAERNRSFPTKAGEYCRRKGELLRPDHQTKKEIQILRETLRTPDFHLLYQQGRGPRSKFSIRRGDFPLFAADEAIGLPVVISIDAGQKASGSSRHALQVWKTNGRHHFLVEALSLPGDYSLLRDALTRTMRKYPPTVILVEDTCAGSALISQLEADRASNVVAITPRRSKSERFAMHVRTVFKKRRVHLFAGASWLGDVLPQVLQFPDGPDDHVDAMTQFLEFMNGKPKLAPIAVKEKAPSVLVAYSRSLPNLGQVRGSVLVKGGSVFVARPLAPPHSPGWGRLSDYFPGRS